MIKLAFWVFVIAFALTIVVNVIATKSKKENGVIGAIKQKQIEDVANEQYVQSGGFICKECGNREYQLDKKGYSLKKGVAGGILTGGIGLLFGLHGKNKMNKICSKCGHRE